MATTSRKGKTARVGERLAQLASALREIGQPNHTAMFDAALSELWDRLDEMAQIWCARWTRGRSKRVTTTQCQVDAVSSFHQKE
jgi:hypothetical protein